MCRNPIFILLHDWKYLDSYMNLKDFCTCLYEHKNIHFSINFINRSYNKFIQYLTYKSNLHSFSDIVTFIRHDNRIEQMSQAYVIFLFSFKTKLSWQPEFLFVIPSADSFGSCVRTDLRPVVSAINTWYFVS